MANSTRISGWIISSDPDPNSDFLEEFFSEKWKKLLIDFRSEASTA
jgi:hypothetical protein